ncbi:MAG: DUF1064 domain-containing protein [Steroidobacteraceae bacterium]
MSPRFTLAQLFELGPEYRSQVSAQLRADQAAPKRRKFGNTPTQRMGQKFDSKLEARCFEWLTQRKLVGEVAWFVRQVRFDLPGGVIARIDFVAVLTSGVGRAAVEVIDAKGRLTQDAANKYKQVRELYGVAVKLWPERS